MWILNIVTWNIIFRARRKRNTIRRYVDYIITTCGATAACAGTTSARNGTTTGTAATTRA